MDRSALNLIWRFLVPRGFIPVTMVMLLDFTRFHVNRHMCGFVSNVSTTVGWMRSECSPHVHGSQRIHPNDAGDTMTSALAPKYGPNLSSTWRITSIHMFMVPRGFKAVSLVLPGLQLHTCGFVSNVWTTVGWTGMKCSTCCWFPENEL